MVPFLALLATYPNWVKRKGYFAERGGRVECPTCDRYELDSGRRD